MATVGLYITLEPESGTPVTIARVYGTRLLLDAAAAVIAEADEKAVLMAQDDEVLGQLQREEAVRLRRALQLLIPDLRLPGTARAGIM